ncbi:hypothetical protein [Flavobacteriaceae bacterium 14752]|uniref:hypothetical protein n=1 Tax=Mesohalobacter salilacus TaxID=2491711 RepID=UPI000F63275E|nr:hypothetical protein EIG84_10945 [Flavobacteriaceae bacterium 14752]
MSYTQNKTLKGQFKGKNLDKSFINVININQYKATISQEDGRFKIPAKVGDSILISSIQYSEVKFVVKPEFFEDDIEIPLKLKVNELQDINLYSLGLTGDLTKDAKSIETYDFSQTQLGFPAYIEHFTREERRLHVASTSQGGIPLDYFINLINGNIKMYKKLIEYEKIDKNKNKLFSLFPDQFYNENLNIPDNLTEDFTYYCIENHSEVVKLAQQKDKLSLTELLPKLAQDYLKIKESEQDKTQNLND